MRRRAGPVGDFKRDLLIRPAAFALACLAVPVAARLLITGQVAVAASWAIGSALAWDLAPCALVDVLVLRPLLRGGSSPALLVAAEWAGLLTYRGAAQWRDLAAGSATDRFAILQVIVAETLVLLLAYAALGEGLGRVLGRRSGPLKPDPRGAQ